MTSQTPQPKMPSAEIYEQELKFMPYRRSLALVRDIVCADAPRNGGVIDFMCGTGYLLTRIAERRPDLFLFGLDNDERYVKYAREKFGFDIDLGDVTLKRDVDPVRFFDVALCTGALHHIPYEQQESVVEKIALATRPEGFAIISDCYIDPFMVSQDRQIAAAKLGYEYLKATIKNGAPREVVQATLEIMANDICEIEFKVPINHRLPILKRHFKKVKTMKTWPNKQIGGYGDYIHILREPRK